FKLFSASKTVTALALGAYLYQNPTLKLETKVSTLVDLGTHIGDRPFASRDKISLFDLISMGTGLDWCEHAKCVAIDMIKATYGKQNKDTLKYVLSKPMKTRPGKRYNYSSGNYMILEKLLKDHMGATKYKTFYQDFLFKPLGIKKATLETDGEGLIYGASGVWLNNQDYSKIGQLIASRGVWKGQRLISDDFIETMMTPTPAAINASKAIRRTEGPVGASLWTNRKLLVIVISCPE
ncbi:MAG: serine hydrolase, partial [Pseudomonadota bacterium]